MRCFLIILLLCLVVLDAQAAKVKNCPKGCVCERNEDSCKLFVSCSKRKMTKIPKLPKGTDCLEFSKNRLTYRNGDIQNIPKTLLYLELSGNRLGEEGGLPDGAFKHIPNLRHLGLERNKLSALPSGVFEGLTKLRSVYLTWNKLSRYPAGMLKHTPSLQVFLSHHNKLSTIPHSFFREAPSLRVVKLLDNAFKPKLTRKSPHFQGIELFQLDLDKDSGDQYEDEMIRDLESYEVLGDRRIDEAKLRKKIQREEDRKAKRRQRKQEKRQKKKKAKQQKQRSSGREL